MWIFEKTHESTVKTVINIVRRNYKVSKKTKLFSGAFSGFKKSEVVEYIEELNRKAKMSKEESDFEISRLENENAELVERVSELDSLKQDLGSAKSKLTELLEKHNAVLEQLADAKKALDEKQEKCSLLENETGCLKDEMFALKDEICSLKDENESLVSKNGEAFCKISSLEEEKKLLSDDVANQRGIIMALQNSKAESDAAFELLKAENENLKRKAEKYDGDSIFAGGVIERAKADAAKMISDANEKASDVLSSAKLRAQDIIADAEMLGKKKVQLAIAESEREVAENLKKVKYLYKRRDELLNAFHKVKEAAGGFYDNIASTLSSSEPEE